MKRTTLFVALTFVISAAAAAFVSSPARAQDGVDNARAAAFDKRLFAGPVGARTYACFIRRYDANHLAQHPRQKVNAKKLLVTAENPPESSAPGRVATATTCSRRSAGHRVSSHPAQPCSTPAVIRSWWGRTFESLVDDLIARFSEEFATGFIAESPEKLRRLPQYYAAIAGDSPFPPVACNAPWMSVVVEGDGAVRPCFFHERIGNIRDDSLADIVAGRLATFRAALDVSTNPVCERCVCSMRTGLRSGPWH